jgi:hypothetical protein
VSNPELKGQVKGRSGQYSGEKRWRETSPNSWVMRGPSVRSSEVWKRLSNSENKTNTLSFSCCCKRLVMVEKKIAPHSLFPSIEAIHNMHVRSPAVVEWINGQSPPDPPPQMYSSPDVPSYSTGHSPSTICIGHFGMVIHRLQMYLTPSTANVPLSATPPQMYSIRQPIRRSTNNHSQSAVIHPAYSVPVVLRIGCFTPLHKYQSNPPQALVSTPRPFKATPSSRSPAPKSPLQVTGTSYSTQDWVRDPITRRAQGCPSSSYSPCPRYR